MRVRRGSRLKAPNQCPTLFLCGFRDAWTIQTHRHRRLHLLWTTVEHIEDVRVLSQQWPESPIPAGSPLLRGYASQDLSPPSPQPARTEFSGEGKDYSLGDWTSHSHRLETPIISSRRLEFDIVDPEALPPTPLSDFTPPSPRPDQAEFTGKGKGRSLDFSPPSPRPVQAEFNVKMNYRSPNDWTPPSPRLETPMVLSRRLQDDLAGSMHIDQSLSFPSPDYAEQSKGKSRARVTVQEVEEELQDPIATLEAAEGRRLVLAMEISRLESQRRTLDLDMEEGVSSTITSVGDVRLEEVRQAGRFLESL